MLRKTGCNQFHHPEVLSALADPLFFFPSAISVFSNVATSAEKNTFSQQLYKTGCYQEVNADNPLACSEGIIQTHAGKKASEIVWWTVGVSNRNMRPTWQVFFDWGCGFINLWLLTGFYFLLDDLYSCSLLAPCESDCTLSEETDCAELS